MSKKSRAAAREATRGEQGTENTTGAAPDRSMHVYQGEKLSFDLAIREMPWTEKQRVFIEAGLTKGTNYIFCEAPPGVGKTLMSVYIGLQLLQQRRISNVYFVRLPQESASKGIGFTPGTAEEKMSAFQMPMIDQLNQLLPPAQVARLLKDGFIQTVPLGFVKGRTFNASLVIVDEAEDLTVQETLLIMGRLGRFSRMILIGNCDQANVRNSGFNTVCDLFDDEESRNVGIYCLHFDESDIKRNDVLAYVVKKFRAIK